WMIRAVGKRIATDERFVTTRNVQLKRQVLPRFESRQRLAIMRCQIKRIDVVALLDLAHHLKFAVTIPKQFALLGFFQLSGGGLDQQLQALAFQSLLPTFVKYAAQ